MKCGCRLLRSGNAAEVGWCCRLPPASLTGGGGGVLVISGVPSEYPAYHFPGRARRADLAPLLSKAVGEARVGRSVMLERTLLLMCVVYWSHNTRGNPDFVLLVLCRDFEVISY